MATLNHAFMKISWLSVASFLLVIPLANAEIETRRWGPWPSFPEDLRPYEEIYKLQLTVPKAPSNEEMNLLGEELVHRITSSVNTDNTNRLAETFIRSLENMNSALLTRYVIRGIYYPDFEKAKKSIDAITNIALLPDGTSINLPLEKSFQIHRIWLRMTVHAAHQISMFPNLNGAYIATVEGELCPMDSGAINITQHEMLLEVNRDGKLLLIGGVGKDAAYFIANEKRWGTTVRDSSNLSAGFKLTVPDQPSEFFVATWNDQELRLNATIRGGCSIILTRSKHRD